MKRALIGLACMLLMAACGSDENSEAPRQDEDPVATAPSITTQPQDVTTTVGNTVEFSVVASGTAPLSYQWQKNGADIAGAILATYTTPPVASSDNDANYRVRVSNSAGSITSANATLTITVAASAPVITSQPQNISVMAGATATFSVVASGTGPLAFQWQKNGIDIAGATQASYTTPATVAGDGGAAFKVSVTGPGGSVDSMSALLTVTVPGAHYALPESRTTLWQPGVTYNGGIPARSTICATLSPSGGDDTAAINSALQACPDNQTVRLTAGQFTITGNGIRILRNNVTLRGAGPGTGMTGALDTLPSASNATLLVKSDGLTNPAPVITIGQGANYNTMWQTRAFAADAQKGSYSVELSASPPGDLQPGEIVYVNETYDPALTWYHINGGQGGDTTGYNGWGECQYDCPVASSRPIGQAMEVASVQGQTVTFTTPFHLTYRTSHAAHLGRLNLQARTRWVGVEDLFVTGGDGGDGGGNLVFANASYSWFEHVESAGHGPRFAGALVHFFGSFRCELRDSYLHSVADDIPNINPGGGYYNIVIDSYSADNLVENNISWIANKVMVMRGSGGGNVIAYNYMDDGYGAHYPNQIEIGLNADHMATPHHELFEGNQSWQMGTDSRWGNAIYITWFRNWATMQRISAWDVPDGSAAEGNPLISFSHTDGGTFYYEDEYGRMGAGVGSHHWWYSFVGNVLGKDQAPLLTNPRSHYKVPQVAWDYEWAGPTIPAALDGGHVPMWVLGRRDGAEPAFGGNGLDPSVLPTVLRDGNFDYATRQVRWHGVGGSGAQTTPPAVSTLPPSLYMKSAPPFFGARTWPWVDGSNAANPLPGILPAKERFDAGTPNAG